MNDTLTQRRRPRTSALARSRGDIIALQFRETFAVRKHEMRNIKKSRTVDNVAFTVGANRNMGIHQQGNKKPFQVIANGRKQENRSRGKRGLASLYISVHRRDSLAIRSPSDRSLPFWSVSKQSVQIRRQQKMQRRRISWSILWHVIQAVAYHTLSEAGMARCD